MEVTVLLVGIGGYGNIYVDNLLDEHEKKGVKIVGAVDPHPEGCRRLAELEQLQIPFFETMEDFYEKHIADLAVISTPIQFHCQQTCLALEKGSNVLCEKPISATIQEARAMMAKEAETGRFVAVGYQWSFSDAILSLKADVQAGVLGRPKRLKTLIFWPRNEEYYKRSWAGKQKDSQGNWILDSVANNATAHYLHNMFFILGKGLLSAEPAQVTAELYRANEIENYDTAAARVYTTEGVELLYFASHATEQRQNPIFTYEFEKATVTYQQESGEITAVFDDGRRKVYGDPFKGLCNKLWLAVDAVRDGREIPCGLKAASSHTICINGMQESVPEISKFPKELLRQTGQPKQTWVQSLAEGFSSCYDNWQLPSEGGIPWAVGGREIDLRGYEFFPSRG